MITFGLIAFLLLLLALMLLLPGLRAPRAGEGPSLTEAQRQAMNVGLLKSRLAELDSERDAGLLDAAQYEQAADELRLDLLANSEGQGHAKGNREGRWLSGTLVVALPLTALLLYGVVGRPDLLTLPPEPQAAKALPRGQGVEGSAPAPQAGAEGGNAMGDMRALTERLAAKLAEEPENAQGWLLLGRSYSMQERYAESAAAFAKAYALLGDQVELLGEYAEVLILAADGGNSPEADRLIARALALDPNDARSLWLAGVSAVRVGDKEGAIRHWRHLLKQLPEDERMRELVVQRLSELEGNDGWEVIEPPAAAEPVPSAPSVAAPTAGLPLQVSIDPALAEGLDPDTTLFIFARSPGQRMPLAIQRHRVGDLPLTTTLSDADLMTPGQSLADHAQLELVARTSASGSAMPQPGDREGVTQVDLTRAAGSVQIRIDRSR